MGVPSLDVLAVNAEDSGCDQICTICDARRNLVYGCLYTVKNGQLKRKSQYLLASINDILRKVKGKVCFLGDGIKLYEAEIRKHKSGEGEKFFPVFADESALYPKAACLARLALKRFQDQEFDDVNDIVPLYLYPDDCQVR